MELNYIKEHTSCVNYKTEEDAGFALKEAALGEHFDNRQQEIKANHLIFILSGEVSITKDSKEETRVRAGEFIFIPFHLITRARLSGRAHTSVCHSFTMQSRCATNTCLAAI